jgi:hypothetical protein
MLGDLAVRVAAGRAVFGCGLAAYLLEAVRQDMLQKAADEL